MDERCATAHARLLAGTCPWCGQAIMNGQVVGDLQLLGEFSTRESTVSFATCEIATTLSWMVEHSGPMSVDQAVRYVENVARQLVDIHREQRLHGFVHPSNVFLDDHGAHLGPSPAPVEDIQVQDEDVAGIVDCLAPEQALDSAGADGRADIYSLGCTLYFLLAGRMPFPGESVAERLLYHQTAVPESLSDLRADVPAAVIQVCIKMMAKKPVDRYETAKDVVDALAQLRADG